MSRQPEYDVRHGRFKIQSLLLGLLAFTLIGSTVTLTWVSVHRQNETLTRTTLQKNFEAARNLAISANTIKSLMFKSLENAAQYFNEERLSAGADSARMLDVLLLGSGLFNGAMMVAGDGEVLVSTSGSGFAAGERLDAAALALNARNAEPEMSEPFAAPDGHRVVLAVYPVTSGYSRTDVYIAGLIDLQRSNVFSDMFAHTIKSDPGTYAYLVDGSGEMMMNAQASRAVEAVPAKTLLAAFRGEGTDAPDRLGAPPPPPGRDGPETGMQGAPDARKAPAQSVGDDRPVPRAAILADGRGLPSLVGYLRVGELGWGMIVQSPVAVVDRAKRELLTTQLKWSVPLIAAFLLLSLWMSRMLSAPFSKLTAVARNIAAGKRLGHPPFERHWNYEAHHLAQAMITAMNGLQRQADEWGLRARTDHLTGLLNRKGLDDWLKARETEDPGAGYSLMVIDIDHFKRINDKYGHQTGDDTLVHLARMLKKACRETDLVCRFGGEEFVAVLPGEKLEGGYLLAERIRESVGNAVSPTGRPITVSIGIASFPDQGEDFEAAFRRADEALYEAKRAGRNRTMRSA
ncbi:sensor domain-containing diguanylate cyclase [Cohnella rhizosphaerae]|uniref:Diguanylate cyclase n=1 Tax=Cohnella rhizosphaerae TaxID=1457232 RepID=A0A9X4KPZ6_9BACL|nr:diguanylate cyclase [Cohnella rhizosphaerae]MDG0809076.1 diguanylate cyclase [Cohnella rhizosphaerae]